jgi:hypothetical protein
MSEKGDAPIDPDPPKPPPEVTPPIATPPEVAAPLPVPPPLASSYTLIVWTTSGQSDVTCAVIGGFSSAAAAQAAATQIEDEAVHVSRSVVVGVN